MKLLWRQQMTKVRVEEKKSRRLLSYQVGALFSFLALNSLNLKMNVK